MTKATRNALTELLVSEIEEDPEVYLSDDTEDAYEVFCGSWHYEALDNEETLPSYAEFLEALDQARAAIS